MTHHTTEEDRSVSGEIKPCPFCGKPLFEKRRYNNPYAKCVTEGCFGARIQVVSLADPEQVQQWNTRTAAPTAPSTATWDLRECLSRVTDHLETWANDHSEERTSDIDAAIYCARKALATPPAQGVEEENETLENLIDAAIGARTTPPWQEQAAQIRQGDDK